MQSHFSDPKYSVTEDTSQLLIEPTHFHSHFVDCMDMYANARTVAEYLDAHQIWFHRCAQPMVVEPLGNDGYALVIGRFGSFGYEIEPRVGLHLLPQDQGVYRIETIPVPNSESYGYEVDFRAAMELVETASDKALPQAVQPPASVSSITRVQWQLDLTVSIQFPRFIHALPATLIQSTGDRLLRQVVRQVSRRLTQKVQEDFHASHEIPLPKRSRKWRFHKSEDELESSSSQIG